MTRTDKNSLRLLYRQKRAEGYARNPSPFRDGQFVTFLKQIGFTPNSVIAGYAAFSTEIDMGPILTWYQRQGHQCLLPIVENDEMTFGDATAALEKNGFGFMQPATIATTITPDLFFIPCVAVDMHGNRLGQGAGHYDRYFARHDPHHEKLVVCVAYEEQIADSRLPSEAHDRTVNMILTDKRLIKI